MATVLAGGRSGPSEQGARLAQKFGQIDNRIGEQTFALRGAGAFYIDAPFRRWFLPPTSVAGPGA
jgi:hypothetical protein